MINRQIISNSTPNRLPAGLTFFSLLMGAVLVLLLIIASTTQAQAAGIEIPQIDKETLVITFQPGTADSQRTQVIARTGGELVRWLPALNSAVVRLDGEGFSQSADGPDRILAETQSQSAVHSAEFDSMATAAFLPNDPALADPNLVYGPEIINAPAAWDLTLGVPQVVIAVVDTGVRMDHEEFQGRLLPGYDFVNNDPDPADDNGHGTHVAGIAGAGTNNGVGMAGMCGGCSLMPVKVLDSTGSGLWYMVAEGIVYAVDNGADIINLSLGGYTTSTLLESAVAYAQSHGVLVVAAVGNHASLNPYFPAAYAGVLGVAATTPQDTLWIMNNRGDYVDVSAPGEVIYSTITQERDASGYLFMSGSSMATPHVSGLAGLLLSLNPTLSAEDLQAMIQNNTQELAGSGGTLNGGHGRVDAAQAMQQLLTPSGIISGQIWHDANQDGEMDPTEDGRFAGHTVSLTNLATGTLFQTTSDIQGFWTFAELASGTYLVQWPSQDGLYTTTPSQFQVTVQGGQASDQHGIGLSDTLPPTAISDFTATREGEKMRLRWRVTHPQVELITVQRAAYGEEFETVTVLDISQAFNADGINLMDALPNDLTDSTLTYRLIVDPTALVVGPITALADGTGHQIFIPLVNKP